MIHIDLVIPELKKFTQETLLVTQQIKADLQSNTIKAAETYAALIVPEVDPLYNDVLALCDTVIKTCTEIQAYDWDGVEARLGRMIAKLAALKKVSEKPIGKICTEVQIVIDFMIGKE